MDDERLDRAERRWKGPEGRIDRRGYGLKSKRACRAKGLGFSEERNAS